MFLHVLLSPDLSLFSCLFFLPTSIIHPKLSILLFVNRFTWNNKFYHPPTFSNMLKWLTARNLALCMTQIIVFYRTRLKVPQTAPIKTSFNFFPPENISGSPDFQCYLRQKPPCILLTLSAFTFFLLRTSTYWAKQSSFTSRQSLLRISFDKSGLKRFFLPGNEGHFCTLSERPPLCCTTPICVSPKTLYRITIFITIHHNDITSSVFVSMQAWRCDNPLILLYIGSFNQYLFSNHGTFTRRRFHEIYL